MASTGRRMKAVPTLIALNIFIYVFQVLHLHAEHFQAVFGLSLRGLEAGAWWQLVTHAFLHGNLLHLLFNMAGLWFAGRIVERVLGTGRFLALYFFAAVLGGLFQIAFNNHALLLGASGAVFGVLTAFATLFPQAQVVALLFFIPVRLRAKTFGWVLAGTSLLLLVTGFLPFIGHAAHLGGCVAGYLFVRLTGARPLRPAVLPASIHPRYPAEPDHRDLHGNPG